MKEWKEHRENLFSISFLQFGEVDVIPGEGPLKGKDETISRRRIILEEVVEVAEVLGKHLCIAAFVRASDCALLRF